MAQLDLFGAAPSDGEDRRQEPNARRLAEVHDAASHIAAALPRNLRFGTSSWSFPGWAGIVYSEKRAEPALAREGLREYARHPLLRTVGIDRSYYAPIPETDLRRYCDQLPDGFPCCAKAPASVTSPVIPGSPRDRAIRNPSFLSAERFVEELLEPMARSFADHTGPFILEISPAPRDAPVDPAAFVESLDAMLTRLPRAFRYAVELRDRRLLTDGYARVLAARQAGHVYNYWSAMPLPATQAATVPVEGTPFCVVRLLLRPGTWYEDQRARFRPFDRIVEPDGEMRGQVVDLVTRALRAGVESFVLVNNKAEGSAPLTIAALAHMVAAAQPKTAGSQARPSSSGGAM